MRLVVGVSFALLAAAAGCQGAAAPEDAGPRSPLADAAVVDAGATDAGATDAGATDAGSTDAGRPDAGAPDAGSTDAGTPDAGAADAGADAGSTDAGRLTLTLFSQFRVMTLGTSTERQRIVALLERDGRPVAGQEVRLESHLLEFDAPFSYRIATVTTNAAGEAEAFLTFVHIASHSQDFTVTATVPFEPEAQSTLLLRAQVPRCVVDLRDCDPTVHDACAVATRGTGHRSTATVVVTALDDQDAGMPGIQVRPVFDSPCDTGVSVLSSHTDQAGVFRIVVDAGTTACWQDLWFCGAGWLREGAHLRALTVDPTPRSLSVLCPDEIPAQDAGFSCQVTVAARSQLVAPPPGHVVAWVEGGQASRIDWSYAVTLAPVGTLQFDVTAGPVDVTPFSNEPSWDAGGRTNNPRDGYATVTVGVWSPAVSAFAEPFLDVDDDGLRSAGEPLLDANGDGQWSAIHGPGATDGGWLWRSLPVFLRRPAALQHSELYAVEGPVLPRGGGREFWLTVADDNLNAPQAGAFALVPPPRTRLEYFEPPWQGNVLPQPLRAATACHQGRCWDAYEFQSFNVGAAGILRLANTTPLSSPEAPLDAGLTLTLRPDGGALESISWPLTVE